MVLHNDALLYEQNFKESIYLHTMVGTFFYDKVEIYITNTITCGRTNPLDFLIKIEDNTSIILMKKGQIGTLPSAIWKADSLSLRTSSYSSNQYVYEDFPDTIKVRREIYENCHYLMSNEIYYLGYQNIHAKLG